MPIKITKLILSDLANELIKDARDETQATNKEAIHAVARRIRDIDWAWYETVLSCPDLLEMELAKKEEHDGR